MSMGFMNLRRSMIMALCLACFTVFGADGESVEDRTSLSFGDDNNIKVVLKGRGGNLELDSSSIAGEGFTLTDYQKGKGYVAYDRDRQVLKWETKINFTLNRLSKHIKKVAPYMRAHMPKDAELNFQLKIGNMGYGSMNFKDMSFNHFKLDVNYGDVDITFPTENQSILRETAKFHLMAGDLEINQLANLRANKVKVNGGAGEISIDFGPKLLQDSQVSIDLDIGTLELSIPKGTRVIISGTSRDLSDFQLQKNGKTWVPETYHPNSPTLRIKLKGPMGDLTINWI